MKNNYFCPVFLYWKQLCVNFLSCISNPNPQAAVLLESWDSFDFVSLSAPTFSSSLK